MAETYDSCCKPSGQPGSANEGASGEHSCGMAMWFHTGYDEKVLFKQWYVQAPGHMAWSVLAIIVAGIMFEWLKYYREYLFVNANKKNVKLDKCGVVDGCNMDRPAPEPKMMTLMHFYQTFLHAIQVTLGFLLMLITMTYNYWLFFAVVIGAAIGHFLFGWKKCAACDPNEQCH